MFGEFREFIARGNVLDLAVAVIIGGAFGTIVASLTGDVIMPIAGVVLGGVDFSNHYVVLGGEVAAGATLEEARAAGANVLALGSFVSTVINFLILAFVIFLMVCSANRLMKRKEAEPAPPAAGPSEIELLIQIRDALRK